MSCKIVNSMHFHIRRMTTANGKCKEIHTISKHFSDNLSGIVSLFFFYCTETNKARYDIPHPRLGKSIELPPSAVQFGVHIDRIVISLELSRFPQPIVIKLFLEEMMDLGLTVIWGKLYNWTKDDLTQLRVCFFFKKTCSVNNCNDTKISHWW